MKTFKLQSLYSTLLILLISSCLEEPHCDIKLRNAVADTISFNRDIVKNFAKYQKLQDFLSAHRTEILSDSFPERIAFDNRGNNRWDFENMPKAIYPEFLKVFNETEDEQLHYIELTRDNEVVMEFEGRSVIGSENPLVAIISVMDRIYWREKDWNPSPADPNSIWSQIEKDTLLNDEAVYKVLVECNTR